MVLARYLFCGVDKLLNASLARSKLPSSEEPIAAAAGDIIIALLALLASDLYLCCCFLFEFSMSFGYRVLFSFDVMLPLLLSDFRRAGLFGLSRAPSIDSDALPS